MTSWFRLVRHLSIFGLVPLCVFFSRLQQFSVPSILGLNPDIYSSSQLKSRDALCKFLIESDLLGRIWFCVFQNRPSCTQFGWGAKGSPLEYPLVVPVGQFESSREEATKAAEVSSFVILLLERGQGMWSAIANILVNIFVFVTTQMTISINGMCHRGDQLTYIRRQTNNDPWYLSIRYWALNSWWRFQPRS